MFETLFETTFTLKQEKDYTLELWPTLPTWPSGGGVHGGDKVGAAISDDGVFCVANYSPVGNWAGAEQRNVLLVRVIYIVI